MPTLMHKKTTDADEITSGRFGVSRLGWTIGKLLKGAGVGANPIEMSVPSKLIIIAFPRYEEFSMIGVNWANVTDAYLLFPFDVPSSQVSVRVTAEVYTTNPADVASIRIWNVTDGNLLGAGVSSGAVSYTWVSSSWSTSNVPTAGQKLLQAQLRAGGAGTTVYVRHIQLEIRYHD